VSGVHRVAATGFAISAEAYESGRPGYPPGALEPLALSDDLVVLDLAAGSGKLTRLLAASGAEVIAVEPVAEMRALLPPGVQALDGTAERIPVRDAAVDLVTVAQAFHWFDGDAALAEIHRVLRAGARLALLWNRRVEDAPINRAIDELVDPYRQDTPTHRGEACAPPSSARPCSARSSSTCSATSRCWTRTAWRPASARSASLPVCRNGSASACSSAPASSPRMGR
jgi:SAM-dependent methyltransferase